MKIFNKQSKQTREYLQASPDRRRAILKKQYLANRFGTSERERALDHLGYLVEFARRLNMVEGKGGSQPIPKPSALRKTDLLASVEVCAEAIQEDSFLQRDGEFCRCWTAFEKLLERVKTKDGTENFFEMAYLSFYLAGLILKRHITDGTIEKGPEIISIEGYRAVAAGFARPLFESVKSPADQLQNLADNLEHLARA